MSLGKRGYEVVLVERSRVVGGRVATEARLPGLAEWIRVVAYRLGQISQLDNVEHYLESDMGAVTARVPSDNLLRDLQARQQEWADQGLQSVRAVGDALAPGTIAAAVWEGRRYAEELESPTDGSDSTPYRRELTSLEGRPTRADNGTPVQP